MEPTVKGLERTLEGLTKLNDITDLVLFLQEHYGYTLHLAPRPVAIGRTQYFATLMSAAQPRQEWEASGDTPAEALQALAKMDKALKCCGSCKHYAKAPEAFNEPEYGFCDWRRNLELPWWMEVRLPNPQPVTPDQGVKCRGYERRKT